jgi:hypothetical protein
MSSPTEKVEKNVIKKWLGSDLILIIEEYLLGTKEYWKKEYSKSVWKMDLFFDPIPYLTDYDFCDFGYILWKIREEKEGREKKLYFRRELFNYDELLNYDEDY